MSPAERYAPSFLISVKGTELRHGVNVDVLSVSVTDTADRADSFSFTVRDRHKEPGRFAGGAQLKWMDDGLFDEGNEVKIQLGYVDDLSFPFRGEITAVSPSFPQSGLPTLTVRGFSLYHKLQRRRRSKPFKAATDRGIAQEIASDMKLDLQTDVLDVETPLVSYEDATFVSILRQRADRFGYEVVVKDRTLYFERPRYLVNPSPALTLEWGKSLRSFNPSLSTYNMVTQVSVRASQTSRGKGKDPLVGVANAGDERVKMGPETGTQLAKRTFGDNPVHSDDHNITTQQEANEFVLGQLEAKALGFISGRGSCIGDPRIKARIVIKLTGLGQRFSGNCYVTSATHTIDASGYRTDFEVKRNAR